MAANDLTPVIMHVKMAGSRFFAACAALFILGQQPNYPPKTGVKTPGVQIPVARLKPQATFALSGRPDWMALDDHVWVSNEPKDVVSELDPKTNAVLATIEVGKKPCSGLAAGFDSIWTPLCGDRALARIDAKTAKVTATIPTAIADSEGSIAVGAGSVWLMTDAKGTLARFDPASNKLVAEIYLPAGSYGMAFGPAGADAALWVTSTDTNVVSRVDPQTNLVAESIPVGKAPRFITVGEGGVWTLNQGDGTVSRIDPKTNKVVATIEVGVPGGGGEIAAGEGSVWVTSFDYPLSRIDPSSNTVVQQFVGPGGDSVRVGHGSVWLTDLRAGVVWRLDPRRIEATVADDTVEYKESDFLTRIRRLTVEGRRAGEGYWSPDGKRIVFQSEREAGNPFYQIYVLDLATGDTRRISPGIGKTTCAFFRPNSDEIEFASTHADPKSKQLQDDELAFRASGKERRYSWDYDPEMDIYAYSEKTGALTRLTTARGYDAEGSYSPDGQWIVFSSMRDAYNRSLSAAEQKMLETNPSYFAEIYIMRADGSGQKRLTRAAGYDGGPFFTPDGSHIVWRRFDEKGLIADVWTMKPDGSEQKQITDFGSMSWAPYMHPSGRYIIFASNKLGFENFELYMVDSAGTKQPVRVTYSDGFDGLPVPSPDGKLLAWTSSRSGGSAGQLFLANWNHEKALQAIERAPLRSPRS
jgi:YVTN family beta-propeller protein